MIAANAECRFAWYFNSECRTYCFYYSECHSFCFCTTMQNAIAFTFYNNEVYHTYWFCTTMQNATPSFFVLLCRILYLLLLYYNAECHITLLLQCRMPYLLRLYWNAIPIAFVLQYRMPFWFCTTMQNAILLLYYNAECRFDFVLQCRMPLCFCTVVPNANLQIFPCV